MRMNFYNSIKDYENPKRQYEEEVLVLDDTDEVYKLVLHNDDIHTLIM